jgi:glycine cleavage system H protein
LKHNTSSVGTLIYKRARFGTRLPTDRAYTRSHFWVREAGSGVWRVGLTNFATRMLGDIVEYDFEVEPAQPVQLGQKIGWIEGFKAVSDLYSVVEGEFVGANLDLRGDITLLETDPYERGWLYQVNGQPDPGRVDAAGYTTILDATIDKMLASRHDSDAHE